MFKAPLAKSELLSTMIYLLIVTHIFAVQIPDDLTVMLTLYICIYYSSTLLIYIHRPHHSIGAHFQHYSSPQHGSLQYLLPHLHCHCLSGSGFTKDIQLEKEDWAINRWLDYHHWQQLHPHHLHQPGPAHQHQCTDSESDHCWRL